MANTTKRTKTPKTATPQPVEAAPVTGIRIPQDVLEELDAWVEELNQDPARLGNATRGRLIVRILRGALSERNTKGK